MKYGVGTVIEEDGRTVREHVMETMRGRDLRSVFENYADIIKEEFGKELGLK